MANPVFPVNVPVGVWTKVATGKVGTIWNKKTTTDYFMTIRDAGGAAPTGLAEGVKVFINNCSFFSISNTVEIDVYLWAEGNAGVVRVDL